MKFNKILRKTLPALIALSLTGCTPKEEPKPEPPVIEQSQEETTYDEKGFPLKIRMENKAYAEHTKGIVMFSHEKHITDYKINCGDCHHDKDNKPLEELTREDPVQSCIECHTIAEKPKSTSQMTPSEKLRYHPEAIHKNCIDCHRTYNKDNETKSAPTTCVKCHPKK